MALKRCERCAGDVVWRTYTRKDGQKMYVEYCKAGCGYVFSHTIPLYKVTNGQLVVNGKEVK